MEDLKNRIIAVASDHAGFEKKQVILKYLDQKGIEYKDFGCYSNESCDYPDFAHPIGYAIDKGEYKLGITFCGSGQGISITANKHQNVRSATCWNAEIAALAKQHNNANICAIPGRYVSDDEAIAIVEAFFNAEFEGGRHAKRIAKIPLK
ncbi:MAG: RpiB/LacA/LacB family sugar-phosphate isomerase [Prolixibacteraceae bacterium]|jgi:ribose 5-phosphate isomerase B|nr:RpiB/LacA/LacB family sugar-phosphate isomerase [Prolixibacteraceae bacterium]MBT6005986.1 RpiB/LacA/LacB family sugar-phosphate isomerase [Prolixibacteraceae bacterium]MBT6766231.1 RpiB/LacA/LacB family sugar-phosphate isomerase [Prolixibacteraceae bacterium]MBT7000561.1 RpiB/LacA/LacB family sugar-phosphate isomerase [Prolixibacteraceae bacterium]MBT7393509.1 RpiB/LacA/LacB family sugar-phosphate isomerase [Prolixibacteraceae bacterium]